jgi:acetyl esterase/lipase
VLTVEFDRHEATLDARGGFSFSLDLAKPAYGELMLVPNEERRVAAFLVPGQTLSLACDARDPGGSLRFGGDTSAENNLLARLLGSYGRVNFRTLFGTDAPGFLAMLSSQEKRWEEALEQLIRDNAGLHADFVRHERARIKYGVAAIRLSRLGTAEGWASFAAGLDVENPGLLGFAPYRDFVWSYLDALAKERIARDPSLATSSNQTTEARYDAAVDTLNDPAVRNVALFEIMRNQLEGHRDGPFGCKAVEEVMGRFRRDCTDTAGREEIERRYAECREARNAPIIRPYKTIGSVSLDAHVFPAQGARPGERRPTFLTFHGGGWDGGIPEWGYGGCRHYADMGLVGISFEYRLRSRHGATPADAVADAQSALRWTASHAEELGIDPRRIIVDGFSAGGHLAAAVGTIPECVDDGTSMDVRPAAMVLKSACVDVARDFWVRECMQGKGDPARISPAGHVRAGIPPAIIVQGTRDHLCPYRLAKAFCDALKAAGNRCQLVTIEGGHFRAPEEWPAINAKTDAFLASLGLIPEERGSE